MVPLKKPKDGKGLRSKRPKQEKEGDNDDDEYAMKEYIGIKGKKYYYNSCPCGNDITNDPRYTFLTPTK